MDSTHAVIMNYYINPVRFPTLLGSSCLCVSVYRTISLKSTLLYRDKYIYLLHKPFFVTNLSSSTTPTSLAHQSLLSDLVILSHPFRDDRFGFLCKNSAKMLFGLRVPPSSKPFGPSSSSSVMQGHTRPSFKWVDTSYGLRLSFENGKLINVRIVSPAPQVSVPFVGNNNSVASSPLESLSSFRSPQSSYRYQLSPVRHSSFMWFDSSSPSAINNESRTEVPNDFIAHHYPALAKHFFGWRDELERAHERWSESESKSDGVEDWSGGGIFPDLHTEAKWMLFGGSMACWLALQRDVECVRYCPGGKEYVFYKDVVDVMKEFLKDFDVMYLRPSTI